MPSFIKNYHVTLRNMHSNPNLLIQRNAADMLRPELKPELTHQLQEIIKLMLQRGHAPAQLIKQLSSKNLKILIKTLAKSDAGNTYKILAEIISHAPLALQAELREDVNTLNPAALSPKLTLSTLKP